MAKDLRTSAEMRQARKMRKKGILILPRDEEDRKANKVVGRVCWWGGRLRVLSKLRTGQVEKKILPKEKEKQA